MRVKGVLMTGLRLPRLPGRSVPQETPSTAQCGSCHRVPFRGAICCAALVRLLFHLQEGEPVRLIGPDPDFGSVELTGDVLDVEQQVRRIEIYCLVGEHPLPAISRAL
jgi:hypothetical protein